MQLCAGERLESSKLGEVSELPALIMEIKVGWEKGRVIVEVPATRKIPIVQALSFTKPGSIQLLR